MEFRIGTARFSSSPSGLPGVRPDRKIINGSAFDGYVADVETLEQLVALLDAAGEALIVDRDNDGALMITVYDGYVE